MTLLLHFSLYIPVRLSVQFMRTVKTTLEICHAVEILHLSPKQPEDLFLIYPVLLSVQFMRTVKTTPEIYHAVEILTSQYKTTWRLKCSVANGTVSQTQMTWLFQIHASVPHSVRQSMLSGIVSPWLTLVSITYCWVIHTERKHLKVI